jgi:hypothetical protein
MYAQNPASCIYNSIEMHIEQEKSLRNSHKEHKGRVVPSARDHKEEFYLFSAAIA